MCGIAGELNWQGPANIERVGRMVAQIAHRGPDDHGLWTSSNDVCVLGHARLSILDLSQAAHQPMKDTSTGNVIIFNGEIYNFQSLRKDCEQLGDTFTSHSDTEVILALYRRHGIKCLDFLKGMFAFALWDDRQQKLFLARDRLGKKPLNYAVTKSGLAFCSELYPLSSHPDINTDLDLDALELYLQSQFIPAPWTIYQGIRKLPPAHYLIADRNGLRLERYWEVDYRNKILISEKDALDQFEEKLTEAVRIRMIADVPLGALLSGGVDSSVIVALMSKLASAPVNTFSIGFEEEAFNELNWAQQASQRCGTCHHPEIVGGDVATLLPKLICHYGEPYADTSAVPSFFVSASARKHVTVALNGDGGDELLGGYSRYVFSPWTSLLSALANGRAAPSTLANFVPALMTAKTIPQRIVRKLLTKGAFPELTSLTMYSAFWNDDERSALLPGYQARVLVDWRRNWLEQAFAHANNSTDRMLWLDNHTYLPDCLLVKMDIASMHCGLETRSPLLDHEVIEFCARLPVDFKVKHQVGKYLLKKLAERFFPADFIHRRKMGFTPPVVAWLRGPLRNLLNDTLLDASIMAPLSNQVISRTLKEFQAGHDAHASKLWVLLMFGLWRSQY